MTMKTEACYKIGCKLQKSNDIKILSGLARILLFLEIEKTGPYRNLEESYSRPIDRLVSIIHDIVGRVIFENEREQSIGDVRSSIEASHSMGILTSDTDRLVTSHKEIRMKSKSYLWGILWLIVFLVSCVTIDMSSPPRSEKDPDRLTKRYIRELKYGNGKQRMEAAWNLGKAPIHRFPEVVPLLIEALKDPHPKVRANAAGGLSQLGLEAAEAKPALMKALNDDYGRVVLNAAAALRNMDTPNRQIIPSVRRLLHYPRGEIRVVAAGQLRKMGVDDQAIMPVLMDALSEPDVEVRRAAMDELIKIRPLPRSTIPNVIYAIQDSDLSVRLRAIILLQHNYDKPPKEALNPLIQTLYDPSNTVVSQAADALGAYGKSAKRAVPKLLEIIQTNSDDQARVNVVESLGEIGTPEDEIAPVLAHVLTSDKFWAVRFRAADALGKLGYKNDLIVSALKNAATEGENPAIRNSAKNALRKLGVK